MTTIVTNLTLDARGSTAGAAEHVRAIKQAEGATRSLTESEAKAAQQRNREQLSLQKQADSIRRVTGDYERLRASTDRVFAAQLKGQREVERATRITDAAVKRGITTHQEAARVIDQVRRKQEELIRSAREASGRSAGVAGDATRGLETQAGGFNLLTTRALAAGAAVAAFAYTAKSAVMTIAEAGDEVRTLTARLNVLTGASDGSRSALEMVFQTAQKAGISLSDAGDAFAKIAIAAKEFGATPDQINKVTETLLKLGRVGGATQAQLSSALTQFAQGLASGLQGDELRSIRENAPLVAQAIAKEFGVAASELKKLGAEGALIPDRVFKAIINASEEADRAFKRLPPTLEQAGERGSNAFKLLFAALDDSLGISRALADAMTTVADRVTDIAKRISGDINLALADTTKRLAELDARAKASAADAAKRAQLPPTAPSRADFGFGNRPLTTAEQYAIRKGQTPGVASGEEAERARLRALQLQQEAQAAEEAYRQMAEAEAQQQRAAEARAAAEKKRRDEATKTVEKTIAEYDKEFKKKQQVAEKEKELAAAVQAGAITKQRADEILKRYAASLDKGSAAATRQEKAVEKADDKLKDYLKSLEREAVAQTESERERYANEKALKAEELAREKVLKLSEDQIAAYRDEAKAKALAAFDAKSAREAAEKAQEEAKRIAEKEAEAAAEPWKNAMESLQSYIVDGLTGGFENAGEAIKGIWKRLMAEIAVATVIRPLVMQPVMSLLGSAGMVPQSVAQQYGGGGALFGGGSTGGMSNPLSFLGGGNGTGWLGGVGRWLNTPLYGATPTAAAGELTAFEGGSFATAPGMTGGVTPMNIMSGIGGIGAGIYGFASGNNSTVSTIGNGMMIAGGIASMIPGGQIIGLPLMAIGGIMSSFKKKPKTPQAVTNISYRGDLGGWTSRTAMSRANGNVAGTGKATDATGEALALLAGTYGFSFGAGTTGGYILNSQGKNTGDQWIVGLGKYGKGKELQSGIGSAEEAMGILAGAILERGVSRGTIAGLTRSERTMLRGGDFSSVEDIQKGFEFAEAFDDMQKPVGEMVKALRDLEKQFGAAGVQAREYGLSVKAVEDAHERAINQLAEDTNEQTRRSQLGLTPGGQLKLALEDLYKGYRETVGNARVLNERTTGADVDLDALKDAYTAQRSALIEQAIGTTYSDFIRGGKITQAELAMRALNEQIKTLADLAKAAGLNVADVNKAGRDQRRQMGLDFNSNTRLSLLALTDPEAYQRELLKQQQDARMREAEYLNSVLPGLINFADLLKLNNEELKKLEEQLKQTNGAATASLEGLWRRLTYGDLSGASPRTSLEGSRSAFESALAAARGGDTTALGNLTGLAESYIQSSYAYSGSDPRTAAVVASVRNAIAPFITANDNVNTAATQFTTAVQSYARIQAEQAATIDRLVRELEQQRAQNAELMRRLDRLAA